VYIGFVEFGVVLKGNGTTGDIWAPTAFVKATRYSLARAREYQISVLPG